MATDVVVMSTVTNLINKKFAELDLKLQDIGAMKYKEFNFSYTLNPYETRQISELIGVDAMVITTMYLSSTGYYNFNIFDSVQINKFTLYTLQRERNYSDSIFLLYSDKENQQKLNMQLVNQEPTANTINIRVLGLQVQK